MVGTSDCAKVLIELNNEPLDSISDLLAFSPLSALSPSLLSSLFASGGQRRRVRHDIPIKTVVKLLRASEKQKRTEIEEI